MAFWANLHRLRQAGKIVAGLAGLLLLIAVTVYWYFHPQTESRRQIPYANRHGKELTYDVFLPKKQNGAAVLIIISGSWKSNSADFDPWPAAVFLRRGYSIFAVRHLSQPRATVTEIVEDIHRSVQHIRQHASDYEIQKERIGIAGGSSGGHLSLMLATRGGGFSTTGAKSSSVQAAAVFFPVTDLIDLGPSTENPGDGGPPMNYVAGFGFEGRKDDPKRIPKSDLEEWKSVARSLSPIFHLSEETPPILIIHGDADTLVPVDQSERFLERARELGIEDKIELRVRKGKGHGWLTMIFELSRMADWFDRHIGG